LIVKDSVVKSQISRIAFDSGNAIACVAGRCNLCNDLTTWL